MKPAFVFGALLPLVLAQHAIGVGGKKMMSTSKLFQVAPEVVKEEFSAAVKRIPLFKNATETMWSARLTPAFPKLWPPAGKSEVVRFAFAGGMRLSLRDGEEQSSPWGVFNFTSPSQVSFEPTAGEVTGLGIQGVRPLAKEEIAKLNNEKIAYEQLEKLVALSDPGEPPKEIKDFYCLWAESNGTIRASLPPSTQSFLKWLGC